MIQYPIAIKLYLIAPVWHSSVDIAVRQTGAVTAMARIATTLDLLGCASLHMYL